MTLQKGFFGANRKQIPKGSFSCHIIKEKSEAILELFIELQVKMIEVNTRS